MTDFTENCVVHDGSRFFQTNLSRQTNIFDILSCKTNCMFLCKFVYLEHPKSLILSHLVYDVVFYVTIYKVDCV